MGPLKGINIIDLTSMASGPMCSMILADQGAEVIKVEPAGTSGDYLRAIGPYFIDGEDRNSASSIFFQAEDGIRDLVRSRGLGDVYKRQKIKNPFLIKDLD